MRRWEQRDDDEYGDDDDDDDDDDGDDMTVAVLLSGLQCINNHVFQEQTSIGKEESRRHGAERKMVCFMSGSDVILTMMTIIQFVDGDHGGGVGEEKGKG